MALCLVPVSAWAQNPVNANAARYAEKRIPFEPGFRVYIVPDMEGMGTVVKNAETVAGNEGPRFVGSGGPDYWDHYRSLYTAEVNAVIAGARSSGARSFVVNEGHGANMFASILPWELDPDAQLIRGFPRPNVMSTAIDSTFGTMMFTGAHSSAGSGGVMSHMYAFSRFTINGKPQNETTFNSLVAGEKGVSTSLVAGDDQLVRETKEWLGNGVIGVVVKTAVGGTAAITWSPAKVQQMLRDSAAEAVRRERAGDFKPYVLDRPYQLEVRLSTSSDTVLKQVDALMPRFNLTRGDDARTYRMTAQSAVEIGYLFDAIEQIVLRAPANPPRAAATPSGTPGRN
ncbi:MAG TPA: M55 family metallopeptidase [Longimicrobiales bacterium]